ncbi:MAG: recombinase family protein [Candidatus Omnitrophica bacterium]|nr:recombinase family protein [Candidatus Omnitrophota bacterium]MDD5488307.1 recombinase family protein [Candidatus Omnitrophota bacterium]
MEKKIYCAIYTRKSTNEGLEKDFTTLDAQRESAENYIKSQKSTGWTVLREKYNDGGFTGANTERPALKRLLDDIRGGKINCVVVYKVDRLSRSLLDFTKLLEFFDQNNVTFVSVTQHFNTQSSMGRLTLNILLSFAQFEREMISERTKDKMGAARKKGKWVGGQPLLGYDLDRENRRIIINEQEAKLVRKIFDIYLRENSMLKTTSILNEEGFTTKKYVAKSGRITGGKQFVKNTIQQTLNNPIYTGRVFYEKKMYPAEHEAIISVELFDKVQERITYNRVNRKIKKNAQCAGLLSQIIRCQACNSPMFHSYSVKDKVKKYRYYVCVNAQKKGYAVCPTRSVNAQEMEDAVYDLLPKQEIKDSLLSERYRSVLEKTRERWQELTADEKHHIMKHLLSEIDYNGETGTLGMTVNEKGIEELYEELKGEENEIRV